MSETETDPLLSELARIALDNCFDAMVVTTGELDRPGPEILYVNPAWTRITGYSAAEAIHRTPRMLQGPGTDRAELDRLRRELAAGRSASGEILNYRKDGKEFWLQWRIRPVPDATGKVRYFVSTQRDITQRKNIEQIKDEVIASVSHEMRSPLTVIHGSLDLLQRARTSPTPQHDTGLLDNAQFCCERMIRLVDAMLDAEKLATGAVDFDLEPVALPPLIEHGIALHHQIGEELGVRVVFEPAVRDGWVFADRDRLIQVLVNLVSNAIKYSPREGTVRIGLERIAGKLRLSVRDHGPGIPEDFRSRLFQRFAQAEAPPWGRQSGVGLGLAIAKGIVEQLGGRIDYETECGVGTTFFVELPEHGGHA